MRLAINAVEEELAPAVAACRREGLGIEVTGFAYPRQLDHDLGERIVAHAEALSGLEAVASHGPFVDLYPTSSDPRIVTVCRERHEAALEASIAVGASIYVAHLNSLPQIRNRSYRETFADRSADFWVPLAEQAARHGVTIVLENLWEPGPELQRAVVERAAHPALKASFDNGHALVFSPVPSSDWVATLGADLAHCHLHDNDGTYDHHWPVGRGKEDWPALLDALSAHAPGAFVVLECDRLDQNLASLEATRALLDGGR